MYEIFLKLLEKNHVTAYKVGKDTGIGASTFTDWKNGRSNPKKEKLQKIADYFDISLEYLMTGKESSEISIDDEEKNIKYLKENPEAAAIVECLKRFDNPDDLELIRKFIEKMK